MITAMPRGVILDWDGVVVDSAPQHRESWMRLAGEAGHRLPDGYFERAFGKKGDAIVTEILGWTTDPREAARFAARKEELYRAIIFERGIDPLPGVCDFLSMIERAGIPVAIGSSTERANIDTVLPRLRLPGIWRGIVSAENVALGKPDPEVFINAAGLLDRDPWSCVVVEDSMAGFRAARNAGMMLIGVATTLPLHDVAPNVDLAVHHLGQVSTENLRSLFNSRPPTKGPPVIPAKLN